MRILVQSVLSASVTIEGEMISCIDQGYLFFVGFKDDDDKEIVTKMADKVLSLRLFMDENGKTNKSLDDIGGEILSVSQFTLYASLKEGRRPSFVKAMKGEESKKLYDYFNEYIRSKGYKIKEGVFGADMKVNLTNNGPFTVILDSQELFNR